jgi:endonuclease/exonuclease/phosphatase family metal-dependent hydrolase
MRVYRFAGQDDFKTGSKYIKLTSYNVKNLSNDNVDLVDKDIRNRIISYLNSTGSDLVCLQELMVVHPDPDGFIDSLSMVFGLPYHAYVPYSEKNKRWMDAIFTFSRFPIINFGHLTYENVYNYAVYADIVVEADTFRLYNIHLESIRLRHEDYSFISNLDLQFEEDENIKENSLRIFKKLKTAFAKRAVQVNNLKSSIESSPYPVILCGDFNDTPNSYAYHTLTRGLDDSFLEGGHGFGNTYIGKVPSFRIDFIFHDEIFHAREFNRGNIRFSDHYPVSCYLGWTGQVKENI